MATSSKYKVISYKAQQAHLMSHWGRQNGSHENRLESCHANECHPVSEGIVLA